MKKLFFVIVSVLAFSVAAEELAPLKERILDVKAVLPPIYNMTVQGKIFVEHDENFNRVSQLEVHQKILNFIYFEKGREIDSFDPELGE